MAHIEDRWHRTVEDAHGKPVKERTARYGKGLRWRARYLDPDGKERNRSFATKVLAEKFLTEVEHSKIAGSYRDPDAGQRDTTEVRGRVGGGLPGRLHARRADPPPAR